jgi:hypothetical protein
MVTTGGRAVNEADSVKHAVEAIGEGRRDDFILAPATHAQELAGKAPALAALLGTAKIATLARQYERRDRDAGDAQTRFKEAMFWANAAVLATGVLGALIMVVGILEEAVDEELWPLLLVLGLCALVRGAWSTTRQAMTSPASVAIRISAGRSSMNTRRSGSKDVRRATTRTAVRIRGC